MKHLFKKIAVLSIFTLALFSCSKKEDNVVAGEGGLKIEFENGYAENSLVFGSPTTPTSKNEVLKISSAKFIISNIVLTKEDGSTFVYPKEKSYFIVDAANPTSTIISLTNIPAANYKSIKFGIGVDEAQYNLGATGQGDFWTLAQTSKMTWSWASGYKFVAFEGTYTSPTFTTDTPFKVHTGKTGTDYNYVTASLNLSSNAMVRTDITPQIHMSTDLSKIIDGANKIVLSENNPKGTGSDVMGGPNLKLIMDNVASMFAVEHVHNDHN